MSSDAALRHLKAWFGRMARRDEVTTKFAEWEKRVKEAGAGKAAAPRAGDVILGKGGAASLREAIALATPGGRIFVRAGVHRDVRVIDCAKPFVLVGEGMFSSVIVFDVDDEACLALTGKEAAGGWTFMDVAIVAELAPKGAFDVVQLSSRATFTGERCLFGGAQPKIDGEDVEGGVGVRAYEASHATLRDCRILFSHWGIGTHDEGSEIVASGGDVHSADASLFVGPGGAMEVTGMRLETQRLGIRVYRGTLEATKCTIADSGGAGVWIIEGEATLTSCKIADSGASGVCIDNAKARATLTRCTIRGSSMSGVWSDGEATIDGCDIRESEQCGIQLHAHSSGKITGTRCSDNARHGIAWDPESQVTRVRNRTTDNGEDEGEYAYGSLATRIEAAFPGRSHMLPELAQLARFQEEHGPPTGFDTITLGPGPLVGWDQDDYEGVRPNMASSFAQFGSGPDGGAIALWLHAADGTAKAPIVLLSGDDQIVLANTMRDFIALLGAGYLDLSQATGAPDIDDDDDDLIAFREWMKEDLEITPAKTGKRIIDAATKAHPDLRRWVFAKP